MRGALRWYKHVMSMNGDNFVKKAWEVRREGGDVRGSPPVLWISGAVEKQSW